MCLIILFRGRGRGNRMRDRVFLLFGKGEGGMNWMMGVFIY